MFTSGGADVRACNFIPRPAWLVICHHPPQPLSLSWCHALCRCAPEEGPPSTANYRLHASLFFTVPRGEHLLAMVRATLLGLHTVLTLFTGVTSWHFRGWFRSGRESLLVRNWNSRVTPHQIRRLSFGVGLVNRCVLLCLKVLTIALPWRHTCNGKGVEADASKCRFPPSPRAAHLPLPRGNTAAHANPALRHRRRRWHLRPARIYSAVTRRLAHAGRALTVRHAGTPRTRTQITWRSSWPAPSLRRATR